ncbi:MAG: glycine cleavage system aminomethyltransferase GcvT [Deltaproteobacteria bacterium]|nr:glycine cleavage system aminomethyltransferase GcvT [Deltaproteobacteria bacterium]
MASVDFDSLKKTPFFDLHVQAGARIVDFGGWALPVQYEGILAEHTCVREQVGLFDVSHMGEFFVEGPGAEAFLQRMTTNDVTALVDGQAQYTVALYEHGGIVDDLLIYRRGEGRYLVCVNAACIDKDWDWFASHHDASADACTLENASESWAQLAIQGRHAEALLQTLTAVDLGGVAYYRFTEDVLADIQCIIARTGYTGEDGFELFFPREHADAVWAAVFGAGEPFGLKPIGLGARDTLRLESKYCLYGNDITGETTPLEGRLSWIVKLDASDFIGREALVKQKAVGVPRRLVGFELGGRGIARHGYDVLLDGEVIGEVTSGAHSPSLGKSIGLCYMPAGSTKVGTEFAVQIRKNVVPAVVVKTPFYKRPY